MPILNPTSDITFLGSTLKVGENTKFPPYPHNGDFSFLEGILHIYGTVDNVTTWYPITAQNQYYIHIQEDAAYVWNIVHNLDDPSLIIMAYNQEGILVEANITYVNTSEVSLHFTSSVKGKAVIFIPKDANYVEFNNKLDLKADKTSVYTRLEVDTKDALKASVTSVYFKSTLDTMFSNKANKGNITVTLTGDVTGTAFTDNEGTSVLSINTAVGNDSHLHDGRYYTESEVDTKHQAIQNDIDNKLDSTAYTAADVLTKIKTVDGPGSGINADLLDGHDSSYFLTTTGKAADSYLLDSHDSSYFAVASTTTSALAGKLSTTGKAADSYLLDSHDSSYFLSPGQVAMFARVTPPTGWLECNGAAISRSTYSTLFAAIGTTFGAGNGSTTFELPDLRGEFIRGYDHSRGVDSGRTFGSFQADAFASHTHTVTAAKSIGGYTDDGGSPDERSSTTSITTSATGGAETRPRNVALLPCIRY